MLSGYKENQVPSISEGLTQHPRKHPSISSRIAVNLNKAGLARRNSLELTKNSLVQFSFL